MEDSSNEERASGDGEAILVESAQTAQISQHSLSGRRGIGGNGLMGA